jgi:hypothetical protein
MFTIVEEEVQKMSFFQRVVSIFTAPVKLMRNIRTYPVVGPMLFLFFFLCIFTHPFVAKIAEITQSQLGGIMFERYGQEVFGLLEVMQPTVDAELAPAIALASTISAAVAAMATYPITCIVLAFVLFLITKIARGGTRYIQYVSMYAHVSVISAIGSIFVMAMMATFGTLLNVSSLAAVFMPDGNMSMLSYNILNSITLLVKNMAYQEGLKGLGRSILILNNLKPSKKTIF